MGEKRRFEEERRGEKKEKKSLEEKREVERGGKERRGFDGGEKGSDVGFGEWWRSRVRSMRRRMCWVFV